jgi:hypothetical protein
MPVVPSPSGTSYPVERHPRSEEIIPLIIATEKQSFQFFFANVRRGDAGMMQELETWA